MDWEGIEETQRLLEDYGGVQPKIYRAPFGIAPPSTLKFLRDEGYLIAPVRKAIMADRRGRFTTEEIVRRALGKIEDASIVLLHDGDGISGKKNLSPTVEAVPLIVDGLRNRGFQFVRVVELLQEKPTPTFYP